MSAACLKLSQPLGAYVYFNPSKRSLKTIQHKISKSLNITEKVKLDFNLQTPSPKKKNEKKNTKGE